MKECSSSGMDDLKDVSQSKLALSNTLSTIATQHVSLHVDKQPTWTTELTALDSEVEAGIQSQAPCHYVLLWSAWWKEICAQLLAMLALIGLFATLIVYDAKPSPKWPINITINTLIAIFGTIIKACLAAVASAGVGQLKWSFFSSEHQPLSYLSTYDEASRGVLGSFILLWKVNVAHVLASTGAILTILLIATDPFQQEILRFNPCSITIANSATMPRARDYLSVTFNQTFTDGMSAVVQAATFAGVFAPVPAPASDCFTGNCTWSKPYSTVGWCSSCSDISDQVTIYNTTDATQPRLHDDWNVTTAVPNGVNVSNAGWNLQQQFYAAVGKANITTDHLSASTPSIDFLLAKPAWGALADRVENKPNCSDGTVMDSWLCKGYGAARCRLNPCIKTVTGSSVIGSTQEVLLEDMTDWIGPSWSPDHIVDIIALVDDHCINEEERSRISADFKLNSRWYHTNIHFNESTPTDQYPQTMLTRGCVYLASYIFLTSFATWFENQFEGVLLGQTYELLSQEYSGNLYLQSLFNYGDVSFERINEIFHNVSVSLTNTVRQTATTNTSKPAIGSMQQTETCVAVRWWWLSYSIILVLWTLAYLFILINSVQKHRGWKSSVLPLLFHGLRDRQEQSLSGHDTRHMREMELLAATLTVRLVESEDKRIWLEVG